MAENAVGSLVRTLGSLLLKEGLLTGDLHNEVEVIRLEFQIMESFLKDADMKKHSQEQLRTWVEKLRDITYEVEDIIDKYTYYMIKRNRGGVQGAICNTIFFPKNIFHQHQIATKLHNVKARVRALLEMRNLFSLSLSLSSDGSTSTVPFPFPAQEDDIVGTETNGDSLIKWLTNEAPQRMAYSVVGMGGVGKTTLVNKIYHSPIVKDRFDCHAWVTVSQSYDVSKILQKMIKQYTDLSIREVDEPECRGILINHLQDKRYVLILDDVWSIDSWDKISVALPKNLMGSRIMITTRNQEVASYVAELQSHAFQLQPLNKNDAWTLFCHRAFINYHNRSCPEELVLLAQSIANKCDGLPLAIVTIGSLLSLKQDVEKWRSIDASFTWVLKNKRFVERVKNVILLSYYELPRHLKNCFLYCCTFPEDWVIKEDSLIRLLVAEGFVEEMRGLCVEDVAKNYINELVSRSMIQFVETDMDINCYQVHDVVREIGSSIAKDENFFIFSSEIKEVQDRKVRRLAMEVNSEIHTLHPSTSNLRSYLAFQNEASTVTSFDPRFKLLKVLVLRDTPINSIPNAFGELFNLRYLSLRGTRVSKLPSSLRRLKNLQTLDLKGAKVEELPSWIVKLKKLRHLLLGCRADVGIKGVAVPTGICTLKCLQELYFVEANDDIIRNIGSLTQLRRLGIENVKAVNGADLCISIQSLENLVQLLINCLSEKGPLKLEALSSPPPRLERLALNGNLEKLPSWIGSARNLVSLRLEGSHLEEDPLSCLQVLPNLEKLYLVKAYDGRELCFPAQSFQRLKVLQLLQLEKLEMVEIIEGAMPYLETMFICDCGLKTLPMGIEYLRQLQSLMLSDMPQELINGLRSGVTEDSSKIQHIADVRCYFKGEGSQEYEDLFLSPACGSIDWRRKRRLRIDLVD